MFASVHTRVVQAAMVVLLATPAALAEGEPCFNDIDCPGGGAVCGGDICNWQKISATPDGMKLYYCEPPSSERQGKEGWCTGDSTCKCHAQGAKCVAVFCSFTLAPDAPPKPGAGTGGMPTEGGVQTGKGGGSAGGTPAPDGSATPHAGGAGEAAPPALVPVTLDAGGCSVDAGERFGVGGVMALLLLGLSAAVCRYRVGLDSLRSRRADAAILDMRGFHRIDGRRGRRRGQPHVDVQEE
ncbi:MAG: hypothetical protein RJA70_1042 [Pseudomonadota bacterium]